MDANEWISLSHSQAMLTAANLTAILAGRAGEVARDSAGIISKAVEDKQIDQDSADVAVSLVVSTLLTLVERMLDTSWEFMTQSNLLAEAKVSAVSKSVMRVVRRSLREIESEIGIEFVPAQRVEEIGNTLVSTAETAMKILESELHTNISASNASLN